MEFRWLSHTMACSGLRPCGRNFYFPVFLMALSEPPLEVVGDTFSAGLFSGGELSKSKLRKLLAHSGTIGERLVLANSCQLARRIRTY
jgi:hypothetical protein